MSELPLRVGWKDNELVLSGLLDGSDANVITCGITLPEVVHDHLPGPKIVVNATDLQVIPMGVTLWITTARRLFESVELHYLDSQLAEILRFDSRYDKTQVTFEHSVLDTEITTNAVQIDKYESVRTDDLEPEDSVYDYDFEITSEPIDLDDLPVRTAVGSPPPVPYSTDRLEILIRERFHAFVRTRYGEEIAKEVIEKTEKKAVTELTTVLNEVLWARRGIPPINPEEFPFNTD